MRRPKRVTFLAAWVFLLGLLQWVRAANLFVRRDFLLELNLSLPLPYAVASAAAWGGALAAAAFGLWRLKRWGRWLALGAVTLSQAHGWVDHFLFDRSDYSQLSIGFRLGATLVVLVFTWGILWWPSIRSKFEH